MQDLRVETSDATRAKRSRHHNELDQFDPHHISIMQFLKNAVEFQIQEARLHRSTTDGRVGAPMVAIH